MDKAEVKGYVDEWFRLREEGDRLRKRNAEIRHRKNQLTEVLMNVMNRFVIDGFDNVGPDGSGLIRKRRTKKKPISIKYMTEKLNEYYASRMEDPHNAQQQQTAADEAQQVLEFLLDNRPVTEVEELIAK